MRRWINGVFVCLMLIFVTLGIRELQLFINTENEQEFLKKQVVKVPDGNQKDLDADNPFNRYMDFEALEKVNEDIAGWIYIPGTKIDYPILIGDNDQEYLEKDFKGKVNPLGSIFAFNKVDLNQDFHICIYGHNMISGQMFGGLKEYQNEDYAKNHRKAYLYTKERTKEMELISIFQCEAMDSIFELEGESSIYSNEEEIVCDLEKRSLINLELSKKKTVQVLSLVTCHGHAGGTHRLVLNFILTKEKLVL